VAICFPQLRAQYLRIVEAARVRAEQEKQRQAAAQAEEAARQEAARVRAEEEKQRQVEPDKIMLGASLGSPIVLAPVNDLLGLAITEDAVSVYQATGLGAWAAGSASRLPALADAIPGYVECVTILVDDDQNGRRHAATLAERLVGRGIEVQTIVPAAARGIAA
jgi:hypothetical protein